MQTLKIYLAGCPLGDSTGHEAGRALLSRLYHRVTGETAPEIALLPRGKPCFPGSPWHFSITHTRRHAFCALSRQPVGLDGEELDRRVRPGLAEKILSPGEWAQYTAAPDRNLALLKFWVLKEASVKLSGTGLTGYPCHTEFSLEDPALLYRDGCVLAVLSQAREEKEIVHVI